MTTLQKTLITALLVASVAAPLVVQHQAQADYANKRSRCERQRINWLNFEQRTKGFPSCSPSVQLLNR